MVREYATSVDPELDADSVTPSEGFHNQVWKTFISNDVSADTDLNVPNSGVIETKAPLRSCVLVPLGRHGVICAGSTRVEAFNGRVADLAETVAATIKAAWDHAEGEQQLTDRNAELERLDRLNGLIRGIDQALVDAETLEAIDQSVCELLADSELYEFAWIGERDPGSDTIRPREWVGVDHGYLETLSISTDQHPSNEDPVAAAVRTQHVQVVEDVAIDPRAADWREATLDRGARSCISIPLVYNRSLYGVLSVYAAQPKPDERDHAVLAELGETIAHAINAVETRRTLLTDSVTELTLEIHEADDVLTKLARKTDTEIEFDGLVPQSDGAPHLFFSAHDVIAEDVLAAVRHLPEVAEITLIREEESRCVFEATVTESTLISYVENEGVVRSLSTTPETTTLIVDLPAAATVREFVETIQEIYPGTELVTRQTCEREITTRQDLRDALTERFTDRQLEILETAYRSGFFESPRVRTGKELSEALGITQSTFSYHLREAQRRLCEIVFENS